MILNFIFWHQSLLTAKSEQCTLTINRIHSSLSFVKAIQESGPAGFTGFPWMRYRGRRKNSEQRNPADGSACENQRKRDIHIQRIR